MNENDNIFLKVNQMDAESLQDINTDSIMHNQFLSHGLMSSEDVKFDETSMQWGYVIDTDSKLDIKLHNHETKPATITFIKIGGIEDLNPLNDLNNMTPPLNPFHQLIVPNSLMNQSLDDTAMATTKIKEKVKKKYYPPVTQSEPIVTCQNCDASFVTKYQYQRHQCEFNASKVILKTEIPKRHIEKPKTKYECEVCHKSFMTEYNLERHRLSHGDTKPFTCDNCGKGFVLESRLNSHVENHCKMSGDIKKYYKTGLTVWQCWNCKLITATEPNVNVHICDNINPTFIPNKINVSRITLPPLDDPEENKENIDPNTHWYKENMNSNFIEFKDLTNNLVYENPSPIIRVFGEHNFNTEMSLRNDYSFPRANDPLENNFDTSFEKAIHGIDNYHNEQHFYKEPPRKVQVAGEECSTLPHTFKKTIVEQLFQCEYCNRTYSEKDTHRDHQSSHKTDKNYECMFCDEHFKSYTNAVVHWQHKCDNKMNLFCLPKIILCKICEKGFKSHELLYAHKYKLKHFLPKLYSEIDSKNFQIENIDTVVTSDAVIPSNSNLNDSQFSGDKESLGLVKLPENVDIVDLYKLNNENVQDLNTTMIESDLTSNKSGNIDDLLTEIDSEIRNTKNQCENSPNKDTTSLNIDHVEDIDQLDQFLNDIEQKVLTQKRMSEINAETNKQNISKMLPVEDSGRRVLRSSTRKSANSPDKNIDDSAKGDPLKSINLKMPSVQLVRLSCEQIEKNTKASIDKPSSNRDLPKKEVDKIEPKAENITEKEPDKVEQNLKRKPKDKIQIKAEIDIPCDVSAKEEHVPVMHVPAKRGRKPKPKFPVEQIANKCGEGYRFQCEKCASVTMSIDELLGHRQMDHGSKYDCKDCGQVVHSSKALMIHCRAHQSLKPYVCDQCNRSYSQTSHLWQHMRFHQGIKPFACPHEGCEARYTIRPDLKDHIRKVHTRERPFQCSVCGKCFLTGSVYYQHRLIHNNDRRYGCDICGKRFFRADALNNHRRIHTDERPFPCPVCGREFRQKGDRNKHQRTQHPTSFIVPNANIDSKN